MTLDLGMWMRHATLCAVATLGFSLPACSEPDEAPLYRSDGGTYVAGEGGGGTSGFEPAPCRINADCEFGVCSTSDGICVECVATTDCAPGETCDANNCTTPPPCQQDVDCTNPDRSHCFATTGTCVECISSADCSPEEVCDANRFCVPSPVCVNSLDCEIGVCDQTVGHCVDCLADPDCPEEFLCGFDSCRPFCDSDTDCKPRGLLCDFSRSYCVECLRSQDCATDRFCEQGICRADLCEPGETKCEDASIVTCADDGSGFVLTTSCLLFQSCTMENDVAVCRDQVCTPGADFCSISSEEILTCADDGLSFEVKDDCAADGDVCASGSCAPVICTPDSVFCDGTVLSQCSAKGHALTGLEDCALRGYYYCSDATGACEPQACIANVKTCSGDTLRVCDALGSGYADTDCTASGEQCVTLNGEPQCAEVVCDPLSYFCEGNEIHRCASDGQSSEVSSVCVITQYCTDGDSTCNSDVCTAGVKNCSGTSARTCRDDGSGYDIDADCSATSQVCSSGSCVDPVCTANSYLCVDGNVQRCASTSLSYSVYDTCSAGEYCTPGDASCNADVCTQGQPACNGTVLTTCNADGSGYVAGGTDCALSSQVCWNGTCQTPVCTPNAYFCLAGDVHRCAANGMSSSVYDNCTTSEFCTDNDSTCNPQVCTPDQPACDALVATTCNSDGSGYVGTRTDCALTAQVCGTGTCQDPVCEASAYFCSGGHVYRCAANALSSSLYDTCSSGEYCTDGDSSCNLDVCIQDQPACDGTTSTTCNSDGSGYTGTATDCSLGAPPSGPHCRLGVCTETLFFEDFEDGNYTTPSGLVGATWLTTGTATRTVTNAQAADGTTYSLSIAKSSSSGNAGIYTMPDGIEPTSVSWWARPAATNYSSNYFALRPSTSASYYYVVHSFASSGLMTLASGSTSVTQGYTANTWYHIELRNINWASRTFDYYVDGVLRGAGLSFNYNATGIYRVDLYNYSGYSNGHFDEIVMK